MQKKYNFFNKRTIVSMLIILILIPLTMWFGIKALNDRKYYYISLLMIIYIMVPFFMTFENREPQARELIIIAVLSATAVIGRSIFFMVPAFKPTIAVIIIAGVTFGAESGFLVGASSAFVSNFIFGQGPWTPWQMFSLGLIGFIAGILKHRGLLKKKKFNLCIFGFIITYLIYGGIMNFASVSMYASKINKEMLIAAYLAGIPFDSVHASSTVFFLYFMSDTMIEKLDRIRLKYGLLR
ncbi:MAG: ECF transporter S component [Tissierellia bacterium]|nr:ECF transporter S component [Tissierellia bacterium]